MSAPDTKLLERRLIGGGLHVASFIVVGTILGWPWQVMCLWALGLAAHLARTLPGLVRHLQGRSGPAERSAAVAAVPAASHSTDTYLRDITRSLQALRRAAAQAAVADDMDLDAVESVARTLHERCLRLGELVDAGLRRRLEGELSEARARAAESADDRAAEIHEAEAEAIVSRLEAMEAAAAVADRLRARERTILHEIDAARLELARSGLSDEPTASIGRHLVKLRADLAAETEVEDRLAQARRAQRSRTT